MRDPEEPRSERPAFVVLVQLPIGLEQRFLHNILAIHDRSGHTRAVAMQFWADFHQGLEEGSVAIVEETDGIAHVEIDAESHLDLVRRLDVRRTPTVLVLGPDGRIARRASGQPRKADVIAALGEVT